jgi:hypothetical protein
VLENELRQKDLYENHKELEVIRQHLYHFHEKINGNLVQLKGIPQLQAQHEPCVKALIRDSAKFILYAHALDRTFAVYQVNLKNAQTSESAPPFKKVLPRRNLFGL